MYSPVSEFLNFLNVTEKPSHYWIKMTEPTVRNSWDECLLKRRESNADCAGHVHVLQTTGILDDLPLVPTTL